ncbi:MAG: long-chain-fatty-acid--CoA ligase [Burkholderiales bacterium]|nr:long-chain-fatty-acid--CoA ligase [Burkholderiales bacterium]
MSDRIWLKSYPSGVPAEIDPDQIPTLLDLIDQGCSSFRDRAAYRFMGRSWSFGEIDALSRQFAGYLQSLGLKPGDRVAIMMPNVPQYPVAVFGALRAGCVVVNVNPLYTARELEHQLKDSGAVAIVIIENFAATLQQCLDKTAVRHVVLAAMGDMMGALKGALINHVVRRVKKMVPAYSLPRAQRFNAALATGARRGWTRPAVQPGDIAVLQYTGGTTGVSKGAMLTHRNIAANILQSEAWNGPLWAQLGREEQPVLICALPLYHIFGFTACMMLNMRLGGCNVLIVNPRDLPAMLKELARQPFHSFPGVNTLFHAMAHHPDFNKVDWSRLRVTVGGGMAVQSATAKLWQAKTGTAICEGYGLSETSPTLTCNIPTSREFTGTIGLPMPSTEIRILDDAGNELPLGTPGEIAARGPQVMKGYWQRPEETAKVMTVDGFFRTGDIGVMDERGYVRIVDRKKDMILVSGFNVYPNEIEDVLTQMPGVLEAAAVGVPDDKSGEAVKVVLVKSDPTLTEERVRAWCEANLTGYKRPKIVEFRAELPKTPVGKILRRALREA